MIMHKNLANGRWFELSLVEQLSNVGSEVGRTINWKKKNNIEFSQKAFERALELLDLTIMDPKNRKRLKEVLRVREFLVDHFMCHSQYGYTDESWERYFYYFAYVVAARNGK